MTSEYRLGEWLVIPARGCIERAGETVRLKPKPMAVLECLARSGNEVVSREDLFEAVWPGGEVSDATLTQCIVELRRAFGDSAQESRVIRTIPKIGFCLVPPVEPLSGPDGSTETAYEQVGIRHPNRRSLVAAFVALLAVLALTAGIWWTREPARPSVTISPMLDESAPSVAVLPCENLGQSDEEDYFVDGIHDDMLTRIAQLGDIKTISRTTMMAYRGTTKSVPTIARELDVATVLECGVQRAGNQIRIDVQLIHAATDTQLWAQTYTRRLSAENLFRIQSDISESTAAALDAVLSPAATERLDRLPTQNLAALEAYFRGKAACCLSGEASQEAARYYRAAIEDDPQFANPYAELASLYLFQSYLLGKELSEQLALAEPLVQRALELDPDLSTAYVAKGTYLRGTGDNEAAEAAFRRALELNPNDIDARFNLGAMLIWSVGTPDRAVEVLREALDLDPGNWRARFHYAEALLYAGYLDEAEARLNALVEEDPERWGAHMELSRLYNLLDRHAESLAAARQAYALEPTTPFNAELVSDAYYLLGDFDQGNWWLRRVLETPLSSGDALVFRAILAFRNGEMDLLRSLGSQMPIHPGEAMYGLSIGMSARTAMKSGDPERAIGLLEGANPLLAAPDPVLRLALMNGLSRYLDALNQAGASERVEHLTHSLLDQIAVSHWPELVRTAWELNIHFALRQAPDIIIAERKHLAAGGCWMVPEDPPPFFDEAETEEWRSIHRAYQECMAKQQALVERWEAEGKLAPIPDLDSARARTAGPPGLDAQ